MNMHSCAKVECHLLIDCLYITPNLRLSTRLREKFKKVVAQTPQYRLLI